MKAANHFLVAWIKPLSSNKRRKLSDETHAKRELVVNDNEFIGDDIDAAISDISSIVSEGIASTNVVGESHHSDEEADIDDTNIPS